MFGAAPECSEMELLRQLEDDATFEEAYDEWLQTQAAVGDDLWWARPPVVVSLLVGGVLAYRWESCVPLASALVVANRRRPVRRRRRPKEKGGPPFYAPVLDVWRRGVAYLTRDARGAGGPAALPTDCLYICGGFLAGSDLLSAGCCSKALDRSFRDDARLWNSLSRRLADSAGLRMPPLQPGMAFVARAAFFNGACRVAERLAAEAKGGKILLAIDGAVVDVTDFLDAHPGGGELLKEFDGRDATEAYEAYPHSFYAREMKQRRVIFAPTEFVGRPGFPETARRERTGEAKFHVFARHSVHRSRLRASE